MANRSRLASGSVGRLASVQKKRYGKTGKWEAELQIRQGNLPKIGDEIEACLHGKMIKARVTSITIHSSKDKADPGVEVHTEEIALKAEGCG